MAESIWSLIPPLLAIIMVLLTRRVLISLGVGIVASALFITHFQVIDSLDLMLGALTGVFLENGGLNTWNVYIIFFIFILGIITNFVGLMGGTRAFGDWMIRRVKTRMGAQIMTILLGIALFIDDYFNSLTVGQVARPITDKHRISRAKLAYIVDSTAAPVCVIAPVSSWGAYILGLIGMVLTTHQIVDYTELGAFLLMIPMNFYVWAALGVVLVIAIRQVDFGPMKKHEAHALKTGEVSPPDSKTFIDPDSGPTSSLGKMVDLIVPIIVLFIATIGFIFWTGVQGLEEKGSLITIFGEADVSKSLFYGGLISLLTTFLFYLRHVIKDQLSGGHFFGGILNGIKSMLPAVMILILAWTITDLIDQLGTGTFLADVVKNSNISFALLPFIIFIMAGLIAFSTGTSWGSFALLLPIAGQIAAATHMELILPMLAAVLAGAVFGDHCSPISDTTILSATGSNCHHIDHVMTQLPYSIVAAVIAGAGYLTLGFTGSVWIGLIIVFVGLVVLYFTLKKPESEDCMSR
ncbi:Na+/H+ antiporter NhaC family protein [Pseudogracilibacillus auburnensis]|uniref:Na+/H+ antiporter NhaC n=1 Tax=Pseudogracilibacillus auburnensis TaxID=1494959 RepID=A0A2V3VK35_9BACI|nr:Na+/H+ antiporter NhaC family protein [Pseudogracilibacillus auburnensis]PXW80395.1 Na+/H+ antiporter NhaC [Pseudogracilibacillus auburnensis]